MTYTFLSHRLTSLLASLALLLALVSCTSENEEEPIISAGPMETSFSLVDSIKVDPLYRISYAEAFAQNGKSYKVESQNRVEAYFQEENNAVILYFKEISSKRERPWVSLTFENRTVNQLPATFSAKDTSIVCVENGQGFADGSGVLSPGCSQVLDGTVTLQYDKATDVISGSISQLKLPLEYYVPGYSFPNRQGNVLRNSGSSRNLTISFNNLKRVK
jgi:hypothetical protein